MIFEGVGKTAKRFGLGNTTILYDWHIRGVVPARTKEDVKPRKKPRQRSPHLQYGPYERARIACFLELKRLLGGRRAAKAIQTIERWHLFANPEDIDERLSNS